MATQAERRRQQNTAPPTAAPSPRIPNSTPTSQGAPQGQPSQRIQNPGVPEFGGTLPPGAPAHNPQPGTPGYTPPQGPTLPPQNGPVFPDDPVQPVSFNGQYFNPTTAPYGYDLSSPGVREQFWNNNQNLWMQSPQLDWVNSLLPQFQNPWFGETWNEQNIGGIGAPGAGQQFWNGVGGSYNNMSPAQRSVQQGYQGKNHAAAAFGAFKGAMPGSLQPAFDAYYDRMADKAMSAVNTQAAARGVYGSNSALNNSIGAGIDVEALRAKAGTDFALADSANQLGWHTGLSQAGRSADLSGTDAFRLNLDAGDQELDRLKTYGDLAFRAEGMDLDKKKTQSDIAFGVDEARNKRLDSGVSTGFGLDQSYLNRLNSGFDAAGMAQRDRENRIGNLFGNVSDFSNDVGNFVMDNYDKLLNSDGSINEAQLNTLMAQMADQRGWDEQTRERMVRDATMVLDFINGKKAEKVSRKVSGEG